MDKWKISSLLEFLELVYYRGVQSISIVLLCSMYYWDKEQHSKAQNSDSKYRQMALVGFDT